MMSIELFPELIAGVPEAAATPCAWPLFLLAYYARNERWAIKGALNYADLASHGLQHEIKSLQSAGWSHVTVMRLPLGAHPWNAR
jgi:hypothetical protein